jgi:MAF protein
MNKNKLSGDLTRKPSLSLILGSSSPFRKELLGRLGIDFTTESPKIDESGQINETADHLVKRLSLEKATVIAKRHENALIIGSDQVAVIDGEILGKPGTIEKAHDQLKIASGRHVTFLTGLCLFNSKTGHSQVDLVPYSVYFRELTAEQIGAYVEKEQPLNCAGSCKSEGLGVALFQKMEGEDPTALIGLPLIRLVSMLKEEGVEILRKL